MMKTKYRGAQCAPMPPSNDIRALFLNGANIVRYQMMDFDHNTGEVWKNVIRGYLSHLDGLIFVGNIKNVVLDIHWTPGNDADFWKDESNWITLISMWGEIAHRYNGNPAIYGYDILNEPLGTSDQVKRLMYSCCNEIRKNDEKTMIMTTVRGGNYNEFAKLQKIKDFKNIYYEFHWYKPAAFCGQGIGGVPIGKTYPTAQLNKKKLKEWLKPVFDFQKRTGVTNIYVGEFAASVYTDYESRINWCRDCISIFEENNFQWTMHAWRESPVWNMEEPHFLEFIKSAWSKNI